MRAGIAAILMTLATVSISLGSAAPAAAGPALLIDAADGRVLYAEDADRQWHPASLTKIMTAYVVFETVRAGALSRETKITYSANAANQEPTKIGLAVGAQLTVEGALQSMIIHSANDISVMLAEAVAGTHEAFVERMNATAARLGMTRTKFVNANGLPETEQVTTARDLARLALAVVRDYPDYARIWSTIGMQVARRHFTTLNGLLVGYAGADGMKTGFTCDSGFNVVASATRDGRKLIAVVLGEASGALRSARTSRLLDHGFQTLPWKTMLDAPSLETQLVTDAESGPSNIRHAVISWVCGTGRRPSAGATSAATVRVYRGVNPIFGHLPLANSANGQK